MKFLKHSVFILAVLVLMSGCAGTRTQRVLYQSTDAFGSVVDTAIKAFTDYEVAKAKTALVNPAATPAEITAWVEKDPTWQSYVRLRTQYNATYTAWCEVNAAAASGANPTAVINNPGFRNNALQAAAALTTFVQQYIPSVTVVKPQ